MTTTHVFNANDVQEILSERPDLLQLFLERANAARREERERVEPESDVENGDLTFEQLFPNKSSGKRNREETQEEERTAIMLGRGEGIPLIGNTTGAQASTPSPAYSPSSPTYSPTEGPLGNGESGEESDEEEEPAILNRCVECGVDMGACNGRQLCGKIVCSSAPLA